MNMTRPEQFRAIAEEIAALYEKKDKAYGSSFNDTYKRLGIISAVTRISDKYNRLCNLATNPDIDNLGESLDDTLRDMAAYCIMTIMAQHEEKGNHQIAQLSEISYNVDGVAGLRVDDDVMHYVSDVLQPRKRCIKEIIIHGPMIKILFWDAGWYCTMNEDKIKHDLVKVENETKV